SVDVSFTPGSGTRFTLAVPLTLTTLRVLLVRAAGQTFALVGAACSVLLRADPDTFRSVEGREMLALGGTPVPVAGLAETLDLRGQEAARARGKVPTVVVAAGERRVAFLLEEFVAE